MENFRYVLVSLVALRGTVQEHFRFLDHLYYEKAGEGSAHVWTDTMRSAQMWDTAEEAWAYAVGIWGEGFCSGSFGVMAVHPLYVSHMDMYEPEPGQMHQKRMDELNLAVVPRSGSANNTKIIPRITDRFGT